MRETATLGQARCTEADNTSVNDEGLRDTERGANETKQMGRCGVAARDDATAPKDSPSLPKISGRLAK